MKAILSIFMLMLATPCFAASISNVKVEKLAINPSLGNFVFISLETSPERIACSNNGSWDYTLPLESEANKAMYALLLAASMAGKEINISGARACNEFAHIESVNTIYVNY